MKIARIGDKPIITQDMDESLGNSINGATLLKVPKWIKNPLANYYLYFAHHQGKHIRLAYSNSITKDFQIYVSGVLDIEKTYFNRHIASPEIYVNDDDKLIYMYFHGMSNGDTDQYTRVAVSEDGLNFNVMPEIIGTSYWRIFIKDGYFYSIAMRGGNIKRSKNGLDNWEDCKGIFNGLNIRHIGLRRINENLLQIFYTKKGVCPESIHYVSMDISKDWTEWKLDDNHTLLMKPETDYEGANEPLIPSKGGISPGKQNQLKDPFIYKENEKEYIFYSAGGENSIAVAELID